MIIYTSLLKKKTKGMTFFPFVYFIRKDLKGTDISDTLKHERVHSFQMLQGLFILNIICYTYFSITRGYWNNPLEIEARTLKYSFYGWLKYV